MKRNVKKALSIVLAAAMMFGVVGCGSNTSAPAGTAAATTAAAQQATEAAKPAAATTEAAKTEAPATEAPKPAEPDKAYKKEIRIGQQQDITDFTKYTNNTIACYQTCNAVFNGLVSKTPDGYAPELATEWTSNDDANEWTFKLRQDVKFHDGGDFTAEDVKFTWDYFSNLDNEGTKVRPFGYEYVDEIVVDDPYTVTFKLKNSCVEWLAFALQDILSKSAVEAQGVLEGGKIGTGPYKYESFEPGISWSIVRNDDYWGEKPVTEKLTFVVLSDASSRALALQSGDIDVMYEGNVADIAPMKSDPSYRVYEADGEGSVYLGINNQSEYGSNQIVRQAIAMAINRDDLVLTCYEGIGAAPCDSYIPPSAPGYVKKDTYPYDPAAAQQLLKDNGLDGITLELFVFAKYLAAAQFIQAELKAIGVTVNITERQQSGFSSGIKKDGGYDMFINVVSPQKNLLTAIQTVLLSSYNQTGVNYFNDELDQWFERASASKSFDDMQKEFADMQEFINKDVPVVPLATVKQYVIGPAGFDGLDMHGVGYDIDWAYCYIPE